MGVPPVLQARHDDEDYEAKDMPNEGWDIGSLPGLQGLPGLETEEGGDTAKQEGA